jgi:Uma2 family endonuclease
MYTMQLELPDASTPLSYARKMTNQEFENFCFANPELVIEREPDGTLIIMSPVSFVSGNRENEISIDLGLYARKNGGKALSSSTGFRLPDTSVKSPDASYVSDEQLSSFTDEDLRHFAPIVPEFIVEIVSPTDRLKDAEEKMRSAWIANGVKLAWLIDVDADRLWIYRADRSVELVTPLDRIVTGEDVLPGFEFDLKLLS